MSTTSLKGCIDTLATHNKYNCVACKKPNAKFICSACGVAKYCSKECQRCDSKFHKEICENITPLLKKASVHGIVTTNEPRKHVPLLWYKLLIRLLEESTLRSPLSKNHLTLDVVYYIIHSMIQLDPKHHKRSILLLPRAMAEMNLLQACYNFLKMVELKRIPRHCIKNLSFFDKDLPADNICDPIQQFCDRKCDTFLLCDLIYIKLQMKDIISGLHALHEMRLFDIERKNNCPSKTVGHKLVNRIGTYLDVPNKWRGVNLNVLDRQALELVKLVHSINPYFLQSYLRGILGRHGQSNDYDKKLPISCISLNHWKQNKAALQFLKDAINLCTTT